MLWVVPLQALIFVIAGMYRGMWRYASLVDLQRIAVAVGLSTLLLALMLVMLPHEEPPVPRSVIMLDPILLILFLGGSRLGYRIWKERQARNPPSSPGRPVLILGAGDAAAELVKNLARAGDWRVLGLLDDDSTKRGRQIHGVSVLGPLEQLVELAPRLAPERAIIAMPSAAHQSRRRAIEICRRAGVQAMTVPSYQDLVSGRATVSQVRNLELDDLLGRDPVLVDDSRLQEWMRGQSILVTGDGGSIGSELCRQIARFEPARLALYDDNEFVLYRMEQEFADQHPRIEFRCIVGDFKNAARVADALSAHRPKIVFHAAAYKHVPLTDQHAACDAIQGNVLGTLFVAEAAIAHGVEKFVMVSTDKEGDLTDVMGASTRMAEIVCLGLQSEKPTRFVTVRFGDVLGNASSIIQRFRMQIVRGGPITIDHPDMTRFFRSVPEAVRLILQAGLMGSGGETYVLDMGDPVKIVDLAREYIWLSGHKEQEIRIEFTGLRSGEDSHEELPASSVSTSVTAHAKLRVATSRPELDTTWMHGLIVWLQQGNLGAEPEQHKLVQRITSLAEDVQRI